MLRRLGIVLIAVSIGTLLVAGVALATTITVNGIGTDWPGNKSPRTPGIQPCVPGPGCSWVTSDTQGDVNSPPGTQYDFSDLWVTNDPTRLFFRTDTYSDVGTWTGTVLNSGNLNICLDSDNNPATGATQDPGVCNKDNPMPGVDHVLSFRGTTTLGNGRPSAFAFLDCNQGPTCVLSNTATANLQVAYNDLGVTEYSVLAADLNIPAGVANQPITMTVGIYFDNGAAPSEDSIPGGLPYIPVLFGCTASGPCSPTAITLTSMSANAEAKNTTPLILAGASVVCATIAIFLIRRRKAA